MERPESWEEETRREEIRYQRHGHWAGLVALFVGSITAGAAVFAAWQAAAAVSTAQEAVLRSSREQRLTNGIEAMGGDSPAQRIAGISLMRRSVSNELLRVTDPDTDDSDALDRDRKEAMAAYLATVDALENYVGQWRPARDRDEYDVPKDVFYAAKELNQLLDPDLGARVADMHGTVGVDLSLAQLTGVNWKGIDLSWLDGHWLPGIDLRAATLTKSRWGTSSLEDAHLQCANLEGASMANPDSTEEVLPGTSLLHADLRGANLTDADLRGADLRWARLGGADLTGVDLTGAMMWGADLTATTVEAGQLEGAHGVDHTTRAFGPARGSEAGSCIDRFGRT
jgi:Pentapeptide repeats (8 copies)